jgi:hypothetical protein
MSDQEYGIFDEVNSELITSMIESFGNYEILVIEILEEHGINVDLLETEWISIQKWMDAFREITSRIGPSEIGKIGEKIAGHFSLKNKETMIDALEVLQETYDEHHQGKVGKYEIVEFGINSLQIISDSPYPCTFDRGMIRTIAQKVSKGAKTKHSPASCRSLGDKQCIYLVKW